MGYSLFNRSVQDSSPLLLFHFVQGTIEWYYTNNAKEVTFGNVPWSPTEIKMGNVSQSNEMTKDSLSLEFPRGHEFAAQFLAASPELITTVTIFRADIKSTDSVVYWKGRVLGASGAGSVISVNCEPVFTSLKRPGLRLRYQKLCGHSLYGEMCKADKDNFSSEGTAIAVSGFTVTVPEAAALLTGSLIGGIIDFNTVTRYIVNHVGDKVTMIRVLPSLSDEVSASGSASVTLYLGCPHNFTSCNEIFDNLDNYGGFPWIPTRNPFEFHSLV